MMFYIVCPLLLVLLEPAQAQRDITVRFLDFKSGRPIKNIGVAIYAWSGDRTKETPYTSRCAWGEYLTKDKPSGTPECECQDKGAIVVRFPDRQPSAATILIRVSTDIGKDGRVLIHFPASLPEHIEVQSLAVLVDIAERPGVDVPTDLSPAEALKSGVVVPSVENRARSKLQVAANAGEIIVLCKRGSVWRRGFEAIPFP
jgi:hypothetical protein